MRALGRSTAVAAAISALLHFSLLGSSRSAVDRVVLLLMGIACLGCVPALWQSPTTRVWATTLGMYLVMLVIHPLLGHAGHEGATMAHGAMQHAAMEGGGRIEAALSLRDRAYAALQVLPYLLVALCGSALVSAWMRRAMTGHGLADPGLVTAQLETTHPEWRLVR